MERAVRAAAEQLGGDKPAAVRLAGVYAMAVLADDWEANRQTCVDVLCAYLRMPSKPDPGPGADEEKLLDFQASREVRHTVIRVITAHLQDGAAISWQGLNFDFTGADFDGGSFAQARFPGGTVCFNETKFSGGTVRFNHAKFSGGAVNFYLASFSRGEVKFDDAGFSGSRVSFDTVTFGGGDVSFAGAEFSGGDIDFDYSEFHSGDIDFSYVKFSGRRISIQDSMLFRSRVSFHGAEFRLVSRLGWLAGG
jgi:hypothetical protein